MHGIGLVVPGQCVHREIDAEAEGHFTLAFASGHHGKQRLKLVR